MNNTESFTEKYYNSLAKLINTNYPQGYQISLIKNKNFSDRSLLEQNYRYLLGLIETGETDWVLDVGCGVGQFYDFLQTDYEYLYMPYLGIDVSSEQIKIAEKKADGKFLRFAMEEFFLLDPIIDHCFFMESIGYTKNLDRTLKTLSLSLKNGANVIVKNPFKIINDPESDIEYSKTLSEISREYGYEEDSLGMIVDKKTLEKAFEENGYELIKFEIPEYDVNTYNKTFFSRKTLTKKHPSYIKHVSGENRLQNPSSKNQYYECGVFVFKKVSNTIYDPFAKNNEEYRNSYNAEVPNPESIDKYYQSQE